MKTQLIPLEAHDDLISIRDRMTWAKTPRILLVWPTSVRISMRALDLKVLQRHAKSLGAQLGLVTRHHNIRREAKALGISVFNSTGEAQRVPWPEYEPRVKPEKRPPRKNLRLLQKQTKVREGAWRSHPLTRISFFTLGVLAVLVIASLFIPRAQVILEADTEIQSVTLPIQVDPSVKSVSITGNIPARELRVTVENSDEILTTGNVPVPVDKAKGVVTFRNLTENAVSIPLGTVLTSTGLPGVRFLTMEQGELDGGLEETLDIPVQAESPGTTGNVDADTILAVESNLGLLVAVTNEESTSGGRDQISRSATESDLARLRERLLDDLETQAVREMESMINIGDRIFQDTLKVKEILEEKYEPAIGQPGRKVTLTMRVEYVAFYATEKDLILLANTVLNASRPEGYITFNEPLDFEEVEKGTTNNKGITRWVVRVSRKLEKQVDAGRIIPLVQGRDPADAKIKLGNSLGVTYPPEILLTPSWWPWLPLIPFNISVETQ